MEGIFVWIGPEGESRKRKTGIDRNFLPGHTYACNAFDDAIITELLEKGFIKPGPGTILPEVTLDVHNAVVKGPLPKI